MSMSTAQDALRSAGISLDPGEDPPTLATECARMARLIRASHVFSLGLAPAAEEVAVPGAAIHLARALARAGHRSVCVVDALGTWDLPPTAPSGPEEERIVGPFPILERVVLVGLHVARPSLALHSLGAYVAVQAATRDILLVDLTGFEQRGERRAACDLLDATLVVARCGRTTTRQARDALLDVPAGRGLGVLLTGT